MTVARVRVPIYGRTVYMVDDAEEARLLRAKHRTPDQREQVSEESENNCFGNCGVCGHLLEYAGVKYGPSDDEQLAYLTDWLFIQWCRRM